MSSARRILRTVIVLGALWLCLSTRGFGDVEGETVSTSGGESADWTKRRYPSENLWAYRPLRRPTVPTNEVGNPVDAFVNARLEKLGVQAAPVADRRTLIRRATFEPSRSPLG